MGAVIHLPLPLQVAFRCKMLTIFALQLLIVGVLVGICAFYPPVNDFVKTAFQVKVEYLGAAAGALVALLVLLYLTRALFPLNWLVLLVFSAAQAALFAALGVKFDTHLGVFNCAATLACVVIMLLLAGARRRKSGECPALLSSVAAGLIAYTIVALAACALYVRFGREFVTPEGFGASLAFQFALILWFAFDAASMYRVMSPDEYMHGVIYFYTDMILLIVVCVLVVGVVTIWIWCCDRDDGSSSSSNSHPSDGCFSEGGGDLCQVCCEACLDVYSIIQSSDRDWCTSCKRREGEQEESLLPSRDLNSAYDSFRDRRGAAPPNQHTSESEVVELQTSVKQQEMLRV